MCFCFSVCFVVLLCCLVFVIAVFVLFTVYFVGFCLSFDFGCDCFALLVY